MSPNATGAMRLSGSYFLRPGSILEILRMRFVGFLLLRDVQNVPYPSRLLNGVTGWKSLTYNTLYFVLKLKTLFLPRIHKNAKSKYKRSMILSKQQKT